MLRSFSLIYWSATIIDFWDVYDPLPQGTIWHPYLRVFLTSFLRFGDPLLSAVASYRSSAIIANDYFALVYNVNRNTYLELALTNVSEAPVLLVESNGLKGVLSG